MKKRIPSIVSIFFSALFVITPSVNPARAEVYSANAVMQADLPASIQETETLWGDVDFGHEFSAIESIAVHVVFGEDRFSPPDETLFTYFPMPYGYIGIPNTGSFYPWPLDEYTFDTSAQEPLVALLDGTTQFYVEMGEGSVDIASVEFLVTGTAGPMPAPYTLDPVIIGGRGMLMTSLSETYYLGTIATLTATPDEGYRVKAWTGTDDDASKSTTNTVTMNGNRIITVEFEPVSGAEDHHGGGGGGGGCFISTAAL